MAAQPHRVEFHRHPLQEEDIARSVAVMRSLFLTTGSVTAAFEQALAARLGRAHAVAVTNGTMALFLGLKALGIGEGDEVITTPMSFIASANVILHAGATPVFVDVEPRTGLLDVAQVEAAITPRTKAVLPVHIYGQMVDMRALSDLCRPRGIALVEDAAHALEATRDGQGPGSYSAAACLSFYATKTLTCGEGGAIVCDDDALADQLRKLRLHGMSKSAAHRFTATQEGGTWEHWDMETLGYKANLPDILSALLLPQLPRLATQRAGRAAIAARYLDACAALPGISHPAVLPSPAQHAWHLFTIWTPPDHRDQAIRALQARGIGVTVNYRAIHLLSYYRERFGFTRGRFPQAERIGDSTISLPLYTGLQEAEIDQVCRALAEVAQTWS